MSRRRLEISPFGGLDLDWLGLYAPVTEIPFGGSTFHSLLLVLSSTDVVTVHQYARSRSFCVSWWSNTAPWLVRHAAFSHSGLKHDSLIGSASGLFDFLVCRGVQFLLDSYRV